jgi:hypothetical protein
MRRAGYTPEGYLWQLEYRDTVRLLQEKLLLFVRLNEKLRNNIRDKSRFVNNTPEAIEINLMEFSEGYRQKFIAPDSEAYAVRLMELLVPVLTGFVKEIGYGAYGFRFIFRYEGKVIEKHKSIWGITAGGEDQRA